MGRWDIPENWRWANASDIAQIIGGGTPSTKNPANFTKNGIPWITPADLSNYQDEYISRGMRDLSEEGYNSCGAQLMPKDTVLFTSRAPVGYCALSANEICTNQGFKSLVLKGEINPKYIRHYLLISKEYAESFASGSTFKELSGKRMATLEFPIPPLNEQKRIVNKIEELQSNSRKAREALETIPELLEQLRQSILSEAFKGDLTKKWREQNPNIESATELLKHIRIERRKRWEVAELDKLKAKGLTGDKLDTQFAKRRKQYQEPEPVDTTDLPILPKGWCWSDIETILKLPESLSYGILKPGEVDPDGVQMLRVVDIGDGEIRDTEIMRVSHKLASAHKRTRLNAGDIVLAVMATIGRAAVIPDNFEGSNVNRALAVLKISPLIDSHFLLYMLLSPFMTEIFRSKTIGSAQPRINLSDLRQMAIPIPPIMEQKNIDDQVRKYRVRTNSFLRIYDELLKKLNVLDQSILTKAFQGELVSQDPNDEPASILLERIRHDKAKKMVDQKAKPKQRGKK